MFYTQDLGLTYDDVLLVPGRSEVLPAQTLLQSKFSRNIDLNIPLASSAMDTVTEAKTAITMAQEGGIGVIHKNMAIQKQVDQIARVKRHETGVLKDPITVHPETNLGAIKGLVQEHGFSSFPVVDEEQRVVGILTNRDIRYESDDLKKVSQMMTDLDHLVVAPAEISLADSKKILHAHRIEKLPLVDDKRRLLGMVTINDIEKARAYPNSNKDAQGRLRVAAAIGVGEQEFKRAEALIQAGVDALVVDTAHGHSAGVMEMLVSLKALKGQCDIVVGNVATGEACQELINLGADGIKVGVGPGSICTTRVVAGVGMPQLQALLDCRTVCHGHGVPYIADGGIRLSGDIVKALAAGASTVMIGSLFAGTDEAPGERIIYQGRAYKIYRGMGSMGAMVKGSKDRYGQADIVDENKLVPEGIEGQVPYRGPLSENIYQLTGGIRSGMGYCGAKNLMELREKARFVRVSGAAYKEGHPHDVIITKEAPNYRLS